MRKQREYFRMKTWYSAFIESYKIDSSPITMYAPMTQEPESPLLLSFA